MRFAPKLIFFLFFTACNASENHAEHALPDSPALSKSDSIVKAQVTVNPFAAVDASPLDVAYFPVDFPITKMTDPAQAQPYTRIIYSRPHKQGRAIFGSLLKWGEHWRLGANEATEIELFQDAIVQGKRVEKGRYILYCIPQPDKWTIVFNSNVYSWGLKQAEAKDAYRFDIVPENTATPVEFFTMVFQGKGKNADLLMAWDNVAAKLSFTF